MMAALVSVLGGGVCVLRGLTSELEPQEAPRPTSGTSVDLSEGVAVSGGAKGLALAPPTLAMREPIAATEGQQPAASDPLAQAWANEPRVGAGHGRLAQTSPFEWSRLQESQRTATRAEPLEVFNDTKGGDTPALALAARGNGQNNDVRDRPILPEPAATQGNREGYDASLDNPFLRVATEPRSTFSIDVDTASYALVRRFLTSGSLPPRGAVRIEEMINYFDYRYPEPSGDEPFSVVANLAPAPWAPEHRLLRIALQARHLAQSARPPANLVFLIDVSGSMSDANKLGLVKYGLRRLSDSLGARDRVSIVVYAGASGVVLRPTAGDRKKEIQQALDQLEAGGSTNAGQGIELAYSLASENFIRGGVNRVLLATDGDFNLGMTSQSELVDLIQRQAKTGVFLSVLGFGSGNYQDSMLEKLADKGNGNYAYVDQPAEAEKVLVEQASSTLVTVAKDVKLQLEFNPGEVAAFRLIGYENRLLQHQDFNDDSKDAGEVGAGHSVTALYELIPAGAQVPAAEVDPLKYGPYIVNGRPVTIADQTRGELLNIKLRYQPAEGGASRRKELAVRGPVGALNEDFRFAAALAEFGMLLRESPHRGQANYDQVLQLAQSSLGDGKDRQAREQFVELVRTARRLSSSADSGGKSPARPIDRLNGSLP